MIKQINLAQVVILMLLAIVHQTVSTIQLARPRGVSFIRASLYPITTAGTFTCFNGLKTIQFSQINDDYCDCPDGSDEPGTSACPQGKFHCTNIGHRPKNIPSSRVNDGICDCCDTSDEYSVESKCINTCLEMGREEQKQRKSQEELFKNGAAIRAEMVNKGKHLKAQRLIRLTELQHRKAEQDLIKTEKENLKKTAEDIEADALDVYKEQQREEEDVRKAEEEPNSNRIEAQQTFIRFDSNKDGFIEVTELQVDISLDKDRDGVVNVEEARFFLDERERIDLDSFVTLSWPRIKPYLMLAQGLFKPPVVDGDVEDVEKAELENENTVNSQVDIEGSEDTTAHENHEDFESEEAYEDDEEADVGEGSVVEETTIKPEYDPETQRLIELANEARNAFSEIEREVRETEQEIKDIEDQNTKDYGFFDEFAAMDGECYTYEDREYVYKLCPFDRASQQQRSGGAETTLGRWDQWYGDEYNKYSQQKYAHGASCWNGPQRSAIVQLKCALEHKITSVSEPNRCEYLIVFETPAACGQLTDSEEAEHPMHDEL